MMWLELRRERKAYYDAAKLVQRTTWIESCIEEMGGEGGGVWEKLKCVSHRLPKEIEAKIIRVAEVRNNAVHDNPYIHEPEKVFMECKEIERILKDRKQLDVLHSEVGKRVDALTRSGGTIPGLGTSAQIWLEKVEKQKKCCTMCGSKAFGQLIRQRRKHFFLMAVQTKWHEFLHFIERKKWIFVLIIGLIVAITLLFKVMG